MIKKGDNKVTNSLFCWVEGELFSEIGLNGGIYVQEQSLPGI